MASTIKKNIVTLNVTVNDVLIMQVRQPFAGL